MGELGDLLAALDLGPQGEGRFVAHSVDTGQPVVFGGQLLGQVVVAAGRTVPGKDVQSLHAVFARGARPDQPLSLAVDTVHAGRTFASVTVTVAQGERTCVRALVLLHTPARDLIRHAEPAPKVPVPGPGGVDGDDGSAGAAAPFERHVVDRVDLADAATTGPPELRVWVRFPGAPENRITSQALLAYVSDLFLIGTAMRPHAGVGQSMAHKEIATTVLTQTLTFHEPFAAADWLLLDQRSTYAGRGRSHGRAEVFTASGDLVASFAQDNLIGGSDG